MIYLDLACGTKKKPGYTGVDSINFEGVDTVQDLTKPWTWADNSIQEIYCSHFVEHLEARERVHFVNEAYRVLKPGSKCELRFPHWSSAMAYGDMTHKWPPISEFWFNYLIRDWRAECAPHDDIKFNPNGYNCNFSPKITFVVKSGIQNDQIEFSRNYFKDVIDEIQVELTKI